jgi:PhzF family phenazine biosynthesis protein
MKLHTETMTTRRLFRQVDVFASAAFGGNPVAVVLQAHGLTTDQMAAIAAWTNLSETTFVLPPEHGGDYRLRIFTPKGELPFGGHPTLGSAHAFLESKGDRGARRLSQECMAGRVLVTADAVGDDGARVVSFEAPKITHGHLSTTDAQRVLRSLGVETTLPTEPLILDAGPRWCVCDLGAGDAVVQLVPDLGQLARLSQELQITGVTVFGRASGVERTLRVRSFAPVIGVPEDPACGSGNACVAAYLARTGSLREMGARYAALQGQQIGRDARIELLVSGFETNPDHASITITGRTATLIEGSILT